jgi:hypothetical protein
VELGFSLGSWYARDRAYDLSVDPTFLDIPHTADSISVVWRISAVSGPAATQWQGGTDESWAIDRVAVDIVDHQLDVPGTPRVALALQGVEPNPARAGRFAVRFALASDAPATLDLLDLAGRRMASRQVGGMGAGSHRVVFAAGPRLAPGIYHVRLAQGTQVRLARAIVLE